ncbi:NAD-dependent protein deacetylase [Corynebacterium heidelbergense]|uniref:NAD-dependent protein deacetylase n=1 Tax=Corynebacterium heidelbergense TaxID=2055947 RepID=UPI001EE6B931|nr:NAD-dependent protein deacetylase [Corynebacterium heidelbergense]
MRRRLDPVHLAHQSALRSIARVVTATAEPSEPEGAARDIANLLRSQGVLVLTGAGVSTDSGIPDYRGPGGSLTRHRPMTYQEFRYDPAASHRYWARSFVGWRHMAAALPNQAHFALAELEAHGAIQGVITQNVDGLHRAAGSRNVLALHGDLATVMCLACGHRERRRDLDTRLERANPGYVDSIRLDPSQLNPDGDVSLRDSSVQRFRMVGCRECGSVLLKPDVVYFGEPVPPERKQAAADQLLQARALLVVGSSLAVMSGFRMVLDAQKAGKPVAVINGGPGRADDRVNVLWRTPVIPAFHRLLDELDL